MEEQHEKILWEGYGLRFHGGTRTRTGLVCRTDKGLRELKKARGRMQTIRFAHDVKECLYHNGFMEISRFYTTTEGHPYLQREGTLYVLEELLPTQAMEEGSADDFIKGAEVLGRMHLAAKGLESDHAQWDREKLPKQFEKRRTELAKIKRRIQKQGAYDAIDLLVLEGYDLYMERILQAEAFLKDGDYGRLSAQGEKTGAFCHNGFKGDNLRLGDGGRVFVGGFEGCSADIGLMDLAAYLKRYIKKTQCTAQGTAEIVAAYEKNCPLEKEERALLLAFILYPEKLLRLTNEYYNKRRSCVSPAMKERLAQTVQEEEKSGMLAEFVK